MHTAALSLLASAGLASAAAWGPPGGHGGRPPFSFPGGHPTFSFPGRPTATATSTSSSASATPTGAAAWDESQFRSLVVFGDSYTDESRLGYFINHKAAPPLGYLGPESLSASDGGRVWARYVVQYSNQAIQLYDYAVSGAVCSNEITPRFFSAINADFPDLDGYEVPAFLADKTYGINSATNGSLFTTPLTADNTVYSMFS
jgi:phospholipase/lecithinase/hemolysin